MSRRDLAAAIGLSIVTAACAMPTCDPATIRGIKAEALGLMKSPLHQGSETIAKNRWPPVIASLEPEMVTVDAAGVNVLVKPDFDGGWGYFVPRDGRSLPGPVERYRSIGSGVYWYWPY